MLTVLSYYHDYHDYTKMNYYRPKATAASSGPGQRVTTLEDDIEAAQGHATKVIRKYLAELHHVPLR